MKSFLKSDTLLEESTELNVMFTLKFRQNNRINTAAYEGYMPVQEFQRILLSLSVFGQGGGFSPGLLTLLPLACICVATSVKMSFR